MAATLILLFEAMVNPAASVEQAQDDHNPFDADVPTNEERAGARSRFSGVGEKAMSASAA